MCVRVCTGAKSLLVCMRVHIRMRGRHAESVDPTLAAGLELNFLVCINVLYVLVPVLVHVLLDGSGHDSAEIDGTVERHATSAPSKQPVPAPRHSTTKPSTKPEFHLELGDATRVPSHGKGKTVEQPAKSMQDAQSPSRSSPKSKIPVKAKRQPESEEFTGDIEHRAPKLSGIPDATTRTSIEFIPPEISGDSIGPQMISRTVKCISREYTDGQLTRESIEESESPESAIQIAKPIDVIESAVNRTVMAPSTVDNTVERIERRTTTIVTGDSSIDPEKLQELLKTGGIVETVRTVTLTSEDVLESGTQEEVVKRINQVAGSMPTEIFDFGDKFPDSSTAITTIRTDESAGIGDTVQTITTVQRVTMEMPKTERTERVVRTVISSGSAGDGGYEDAESALKDLHERITKSEIGDTASWVAAATALTNDGKSGAWVMSKHREEQPEQWGTAQFSQDTSPGSGNDDAYVNNNHNSNNNNNNKSGSARHEMHSDTDSDGSPQPRRRSPSKRRTLGSSSGSDVALHEGAELSPLEDDQGIALSQLNLLSKQCTYPQTPASPC